MPKPTTTRPRALTDFEQILLGLIGADPRSGYELKHLFQATPAAAYCPSDGALYPALRRLEERGLLRSEPAMSGMRARHMYRATAEGRTATQKWLTEGVGPGSVGRDLGLHLMRFVLMEGTRTASDVQRFLAQLVAALERFVDSIEVYLGSTPLPGRHPRLALEHGIAVHRASLEWARSAMAALEKSENANGHQDLPTGGHFGSPGTDRVIPHGRS